MPQTQIVDELARELAAPEQVSFKKQYLALRELPSSPTDLATFLGELLRGIAKLYAATAAAIWFRHPGSQKLDCKAAVGYQSLGLTGDLTAAHEQLLQFALGQDRPFVVKPFSAPEPHQPAANPTDSFVVLAPVIHRREAIAVVELFLGPTPLRGQTARLRAKYAQWLGHLTLLLCDGLERRFLASPKPLDSAMSHLDRVTEQAHRYQEEIRRNIEQSLHVLAGQNFGNLKANQAVANRVHQLLESKGLRVKCPECGAAAILRCQGAGGSKTGVFLFDHYLETGRTFHGGPTTFPLVAVVPKPPRRPRS